METQSPASAAVNKILGAKGKKLHTLGMHIRRTANKGFITKHELGDKEGMPPSDGQRPDAEYSHSNIQELMAHVQQHMQEPEPDADDQEA